MGHVIEPKEVVDKVLDIVGEYVDWDNIKSTAMRELIRKLETLVEENKRAVGVEK